MNLDGHHIGDIHHQIEMLTLTNSTVPNGLFQSNSERNLCMDGVGASPIMGGY